MRKKAPGFQGLPKADVLVYLEVARVALGDADIFDGVAESLDLSDDEMLRLREQLTEFMGGRV
jgi:ATP phosphoribosyltransferase regulatory subunit HisZ